MNSKNLIISIIVLVVLATIAFFVMRPATSDKRADRMGEPLFENLPLAEVAAIEISGFKEGQPVNVTLKSHEDQWVVENRNGYPANFKAISELVEKFRDAKIGRGFIASPETLARLGLVAPDKVDAQAEQKALRVKFLARDGKVLTDILVGNPRESDTGAGGHYVKTADGETVYLVDQTFRYTDTEPSDWLETQLLDIQADTIQSVTALAPGKDSPIYTARRPEKGKPPVLENPPADEKVQPAKLNSLFGALASVRIEDVAAPAGEIPDEKTGFDKNPALKFKQYDGTVYHVFPGNPVENGDDQYYLKIQVEYEQGEKSSDKDKPGTDSETAGETGDKAVTEPVTVEAAEADKDKKPEEQTPTTPDPAEIEFKAKELNNEFSQWVYILPQWKYKNLILDKSEFFEKKEDSKDDA